MIYFIRVQNYIKIGYSRRPQTRIVTHQTSNPQAIEVLGIFPGDKSVEVSLHRELADYRVRGEWFADITPLLDGLFAKLASGSYTVIEHDNIPTVNIHKGGYARRGGWIEYRKKNGRRYARRRSWKLVDGEWRKVFHGRVVSLPVMTEAMYQRHLAEQQLARHIRAVGSHRKAVVKTLGELGRI